VLKDYSNIALTKDALICQGYRGYGGKEENAAYMLTFSIFILLLMSIFRSVGIVEK
jgi:hypothetical protein